MEAITMKIKKLNKKLELRKTTVSDLNSNQMNAVKGGLTWTDPRACNTAYQCSIYQTIRYTCEVGCPACSPPAGTDRTDCTCP